MPAKTPVRPKHMPRRTCVGCGAVSAKRTLIRIVRSPEGEIQQDPTGKKPGRGAYLCPNRRCWEQALKKGRLERSLKATPPPGNADSLQSLADSLGLSVGEAR